MTKNDFICLFARGIGEIVVGIGVIDGQLVRRSVKRVNLTGCRSDLVHARGAEIGVTQGGADEYGPRGDRRDHLMEMVAGFDAIDPAVAAVDA